MESQCQVLLERSTLLKEDREVLLETQWHQKKTCLATWDVGSVSKEELFYRVCKARMRSLGPTWDKFQVEGGVTKLGLPRSDVYNYFVGPSVTWRADFVNASIVWTEGDASQKTTLLTQQNSFRCEYFANGHFQGEPAYIRFEPSLVFDWENGAPGTWVGPDDFSVRCTGTLQVSFLVGWWYNFLVAADDGVRVKIDGTVVFNSLNTGMDGKFTRHLGRGNHQLVVEYREKDAAASMALRWAAWPAKPVIAAEIVGPMERVPASVLEYVSSPETPSPATSVVPTTYPTLRSTTTPTAIARRNYPVIHPDWTSFTSDNHVYDLLVDGDMIWTATLGGVVQWDSRTGEYFKIATEHGLASNGVSCIAADSKGALWFGTDAGVSRLDRDGQWRTFTVTDGLTDNNITALAVAPDWAIWVGTAFSGCDRCQSGVSALQPDGRWKKYPLSKPVSAIAVTPDGKVWVATGAHNCGNCGGGASRLRPDGIWETFTSSSGLGSDDVLSLAVTSDGSVWFGTAQGRIAKLASNGKWQGFAVGGTNETVDSLAVGSDGSMWFGTTYGIGRLKANGSVERLPTSVTRPSYYFMAIEPMPNGIVWTGNFGGLYRVSPDGTWQTYTTKDVVPEAPIRSIAVASDGAVWFGSAGMGAYRLDPRGTWSTYYQTNGLAGSYVQAIEATRDRGLWFGFGEQGCTNCDIDVGVSHIRPDGSWETLTSRNGLPSNNVSAIAATSDGSIWFGTRGAGLAEMRPDWQDTDLHENEWVT